MGLYNVLYAKEPNQAIKPIEERWYSFTFLRSLLYTDPRSKNNANHRKTETGGNLMSESNEALKIWEALRGMVDAEIDAKTKSCMRAQKMSVTTAPDGTVMGVSAPFGEEIMIPYTSALSSASVGDAVWVTWYYGNASTMIATAVGDG